MQLCLILVWREILRIHVHFYMEKNIILEWWHNLLRISRFQVYGNPIQFVACILRINMMYSFPIHPVPIEDKYKGNLKLLCCHG